MRALAFAVLFAIASASCKSRAPTATPEGSVRELVERLRRTTGDPANSKATFELLSKRARENLERRAQRYLDASGKPIPPEAMLVPSRFELEFEPQRFVARVDGERAVVEVAGVRSTDRAAVPCVFEDNGWRVDLSLPPLPPVQLRPGAAP